MQPIHHLNGSYSAPRLVLYREPQHIPIEVHANGDLADGLSIPEMDPIIPRPGTGSGRDPNLLQATVEIAPALGGDTHRAGERVRACADHFEVEGTRVASRMQRP